MNPDVLLVSLGSTAGLRAADEELLGALRRAGASAELAQTQLPSLTPPTFALVDLVQARAARRAALDAQHRHGEPRALIYSTSTAALLWPRPGAIRFDSLARDSRPGRHGLWQRPVERRRLEQAPLLLPWSEASGAPAGERRVVLPVAVEPSGPPAPERDIAAITYAAHPHKKGLDRVLEAWRQARRPGERLLVCGVDELRAQEGVEAAGSLPRKEFRGLVRRSRVFVSAPRREDHGLAQLEALADGCLLVTTPAPGPYAALELARTLDPRLVCSSQELGRALRSALDDPAPGYRERATSALAPLRRQAIDRQVAGVLLPALLSGSRRR